MSRQQKQSITIKQPSGITLKTKIYGGQRLES